MNINLHIERLVLDGAALEPQQRIELKATKTQLNHLLVANGISSDVQSNSSFHALQGDLITIDINRKPFVLGHQTAQSVYEGFDHV